jgi:hypothetical protein
MSRFVHDSTIHFQGLKIGSHKSDSPPQGILATTSIQKKSHVQFQKIQNIFLQMIQIPLKEQG